MSNCYVFTCIRVSDRMGTWDLGTFGKYWRLKWLVVVARHIYEKFFRRDSGSCSFVGNVGFVLERRDRRRKSSSTHRTPPLYRLSEGVSSARLPAFRDGQRGTGWEPAPVLHHGAGPPAAWSLPMFVIDLFQLRRFYSCRVWRFWICLITNCWWVPWRTLALLWAPLHSWRLWRWAGVDWIRKVSLSSVGLGLFWISGTRKHLQPYEMMTWVQSLLCSLLNHQKLEKGFISLTC